LGPEHVDPGLPDGTLASLSQGQGRVIIAATEAGAPAFVIEGAKNGTFTRYLLEALRGSALGHRGVIRVVDLFDYLAEKLPNASPPQSPVFKAQFKQNFPIALHLGGKSGSGETVQGGLAVLIRLAKDPALAPVLFEAREHLKAAWEQMGPVNNLKQVHEALHSIQINRFEQILIERDRLSRDDQAGKNLVRHVRRVARCVNDLGDPASLPPIPDLALPERLAEMAAAAHKIELGVNAGSTQLINQGIWELSEVLSVVPSKVNNELKGAIRAMKLHGLFGALLKVEDAMQRSQVKPEDVRTFAAGGTDLGRLDRDIDDFMSQHDAWQRIDDLMRRIDNNGKGEPDDLEAAWSTLHSLLEQQLDGVDESYRDEIEAADLEVQAAMGTPGLAAKIEPYWRLRGIVRDWFFAVDKRLLGICKQLIPINAALKVVLASLQEAPDEHANLA
jgi:hypothetical protein